MKKIIESVLTGLLLGAIGASAKSIIDVQSLKADNMTTKDLMREMRQDIKQIKNILIERL